MARTTKRDLFAELAEGVEAMQHHREGKITLRTHKVTPKQLPAIDSDFIRKTRDQLGMSQGVFAAYLQLNHRTLERWESGAKPNHQAAVLIRLVRKFPDMVERIRELAEETDAEG